MAIQLELKLYSCIVIDTASQRSVRVYHISKFYFPSAYQCLFRPDLMP